MSTLLLTLYEKEMMGEAMEDIEDGIQIRGFLLKICGWSGNSSKH